MRQLSFVTAALVTASVLFAGSIIRSTPSAVKASRPISVRIIERARRSIVSLGNPQIRGAGVLVSESGHVLTCAHVSGSSAEIAGVLPDGRPRSAHILARSGDLALLKFSRRRDDERFVPMKLAGAMSLRPGEPVIAIGHPFSKYDYTATKGIISAVGREITNPLTGEGMTDLLQFDAPINIGNSGGPVLNLDGEVLGLVVAFHDGSQRIGFAIGVACIRSFLRDNGVSWDR